METSISFEFNDDSFTHAKTYFLDLRNVTLENESEKERWLKILQLFFYSQEIDDEDVLITKVLNYLYTGKLGDGKFTSQTNDLLIDGKKKKKIKDHFSDSNNRTDLIAKKNFFLNLYNLYLNILHDYFSSIEATKTYGKMLIYEAPPFEEVPSVVNHFLLNGDKYLNAIIEASPGKQFIEKIRADFQEKVKDFTEEFSNYSIYFKKTSVHPPEIFRYFNPESLKNNEEELNRNNIIEKLIEEYQDTSPEHFQEKIQTYLEELIAPGEKKNKKNKRFKRDEKRIWKEFFNTLIEQDELFLNLEKAVTSEIVYIDLILAPIYIDSELRKAWSTKDEFLFHNKTLPVLLFEWAIEHFKYTIRQLKNELQNENQLLSTNCLIAMGTPLNTSVSIYEHFADKMFLIDTYTKPNKVENHIDLTQLNSPVAFRKFENRGRGVVFPMFKSNVIGGNHYPDYRLVKHAFDIPN